MSKVQKTPYTGKYQINDRVLVNDGGTYASNRGMIVEIKPDKPDHNYRVTFDVFASGLWLSEGELLPDNKKPYHKAADFVALINSCGTLDEACAKTGRSYNYLLQRCYILRKKGFDIKRFPLDRRLGVVGWLRECYPDVYRDLRENYPDVYNATNGKI